MANDQRSVRFPRMHIAESVVNRILNVNDSLEEARISTLTAPTRAQPRVPSVARQSDQLDAALAVGVPALPGIGDAPDPGGTAAGDSLLDTVLTPEA